MKWSESKRKKEESAHCNKILEVENKFEQYLSKGE